ncbi:hypothetical protein PInf_027452 [Phytophthora infestans]|nr:hypothetical protein PInf_027452 [Phytophthora infestans]
MARQKGQKGGHTTLLQRQFMVEWLKKTANFSVIVGKANDDHSAGFGGARTKISGFGQMAEERLDSQTGFGLTESQLKAGLALEEAVEKACPFYIEGLFGGRQNISPFSIMDNPSANSDGSTQEGLYGSAEAGEPSLSFNLAQSAPSYDASSPSSYTTLVNEEEEHRGEHGSDRDEDFDISNLPSTSTASDGHELIDTAEQQTDGTTSELPTQYSQASVSPTTTAPTPAHSSSVDTPQRTGAATGSAKANQARKRDFATTFREFSEKRLHAESSWRREELEEARASRLAAEARAIREQEERRDERQLRFREAQSAVRKELLLQLLQRGKTEDEALSLVDQIAPL